MKSKGLIIWAWRWFGAQPNAIFHLRRPRKKNSQSSRDRGNENSSRILPVSSFHHKARMSLPEAWPLSGKWTEWIEPIVRTRQVCYFRKTDYIGHIQPGLPNHLAPKHAIRRINSTMYVWTSSQELVPYCQNAAAGQSILCTERYARSGWGIVFDNEVATQRMRIRCNFGWAEVRGSPQFRGSRGLSRADREEEKDREMDKGSGQRGKGLGPWRI